MERALHITSKMEEFRTLFRARSRRNARDHGDDGVKSAVGEFRCQAPQAVRSGKRHTAPTFPSPPNVLPFYEPCYGP